MRRADRLVRAAAAAACLVASAAACTGPSEPAIPSLEPVALGAPAEAPPPRARVLEKIRLYARGPDGPPLISSSGDLLALESGREVVILAEQSGRDASWLRAWVVPSSTIWPGDFVAWFPSTIRGRKVVEVEPAVRCPDVATITTLAPLLPIHRLACAGDRSLTLDARSWLAVDAPSYDADPAWFGTSVDPASSVALFDPGPTLFGSAARTSPEAAGAWIDARVPPDLPPLPAGVYLRVSGRFDDPAAADCRRRRLNAGATVGLPNEAVAESVLWCRSQFVVTRWHALLGSEGRPIDPADPQLHRPGTAEAAPLGAGCRGIGVPVMRLRIDPSLAEPVWLEADGRRRIAVFADAFRFARDPVRVQSPTGAAFLDGEVIDPAVGKPGVAICARAATVTFDAAPADGS